MKVYDLCTASHFLAHCRMAPPCRRCGGTPNDRLRQCAALRGDAQIIMTLCIVTEAEKRSQRSAFSSVTSDWASVLLVPKDWERRGHE